MALTITGGLNAPRRINVYGQQHFRMANDMVGRLVKVVRGNAPLSPLVRRQLAPIQRRTALRMATKQLPYIPQADVLEIYKLVKL